jgi:transposase-like protein
LSVVAFCRKEGISEAAFYYWRKKLSGGGSKSDRQGTPAFIEVAIPGRDTVALELLLTSGNTLRIGPGVDNKRLSDVLSVLRKAGLC